tara:strand:+ start:736 stop:1734 length:999 start_codon:yes stop_codon:yes gene_type:complete
MKILIIGENNFNSLERIYKKNFLKLKCQSVNIYSFWKPKIKILKKFLNFQEKYFYFFFCFIQNILLKKKLKGEKIVYDIVIVFNGYHLDQKTISIIRKKASKSLINIQTDNIFIKKNILYKNIKLFDKIYVWSKNIQKKIITNLKFRKNKVIFLPFGYDQFLIKKNKNKKLNNYILFYGSWDQDRENILQNIDNKTLKIYGNGWNNAKIQFKKKYYIKGELVGKRLISEISKSLLCLNLFRFQAKNFINMRSFEVLGYGGTLLSEYSNEQCAFFSNYDNIIYFNNIEDVNLIYKKILSKKKLLLKKREKNKKKMIKHSYFNRAKFILNNEKI